MATQRLTKKAMLEQIRARLASQDFAPTGGVKVHRIEGPNRRGAETIITRESEDRVLDIHRAADFVLRENGYDSPGDYHNGELGQVIETLTAKRPEIISGNRVGRQTFCAARTVKENGQEPGADGAQVKFERRTYTVSTHSTHPYKRRLEPRWSRSELDLMLYARNVEVYRQDHKEPVVCMYPPRQYHVNGALDFDPNDRPLSVIAMARKYAFRNAAEDRAIADMLKANKDAIRRENPPVTPAHPAVSRPSDLDSLGLARPVFRPSAKWMHVSPVPLSASSASAHFAHSAGGTL
jgi:hypothetical protein